MLFKGVLGALCALFLLSSAPQAYASVTPNSCRFSIDNWYRDMPVTLNSTASIVPDARYPSPVDAEPGQTLKTAAGTAAVALPDNLARYGYIVGLLQPGHNEIPVDVWIAIRATNTKERVQVVGPIRVTATTTIDVDPVDGAFLSSTPWQYTTPQIPELTWTAVGGDVVFSQAGPGSLPPLAIGPGGSNRTPIGSVIINALIPGGLIFYMDCQPGATNDVSPVDLAGPSLTPGPAAAFDTLDGPHTTTCLSALGRQVSGAPANLPAGIDRELDPMRIALSATGFAPEFTVGTPYTLPTTTLSAVLSTDTLATLGRFEEGGEPLVVAGKSYPVDVWVTIAASNTAEGAQTVRATAAYIPSATFDAISLTVALPATTWTPTGAGPVRFTLGLPGSAATIQTPQTMAPYGSVVMAMGTERNAALLDCAPAAIRVADPAIPWSDAGRTGSAGRYAIDPNLDTPVFATAVDGRKPPVVTPVPTAAPSPTATPGPPPTHKAPAGRVDSSRLTSRGGKIELRLSCPAGSMTCRGTAVLRSASKLKVGKRTKIVTLSRSLRYTIAPGKRRTFVLALSKDGRAALARKRTIKARITLSTSAGVTATRRLDLRRSG